MKYPLVSVIIPAYNASKTIVKTVDSVLNQTYKNLELIIVDDGSEDNTLQLVQRIAEKYQRVTLLRQANLGVAKARNLAIKKAQGMFIAPVDADDIWHPTKITKQVNKMLNSSQLFGLVYCWSIGIDEEDYLMKSFSREHLKRFNTIEGLVYPALLYRNFIGNASSPLIRRSCLDQVGLYDYYLHRQNAQGCEDWDLYLRIAEVYEFGVIPEFLIGYRRLPNSMSKNLLAMEKSHEIVLSKFQTRHPEIPAWIYSLSRSNFYTYLAQKSNQSQNTTLTLNYLIKILLLDYYFLLSLKTYKILLGLIKSVVSKSVTINLKIVRDLTTLKKHKSKSSSNSIRKKYSDGLEQIDSFTNKDIIYDLIYQYRWHKISKTIVQKSKSASISSGKIINFKSQTH